MKENYVLRATLWTSVALNWGGAALLALPASLVGQLVGLPGSVPRLYSTLCALFVALFGGAYAWLARQPHIDRPLIAFAAITKAAVFSVFFILWLAGDLPGRSLMVVLPHLVK